MVRSFIVCGTAVACIQFAQLTLCRHYVQRYEALHISPYASFIMNLLNFNQPIMHLVMKFVTEPTCDDRAQAQAGGEKRLKYL